LHAQPAQATTLAHRAGTVDLEEDRYGVVGEPPLLAREVLDELPSRGVALENVVVVHRLLEETTRRDQGLNGRDGRVCLPEERLTVDLEDDPAVDLDARIRADHLQVQDKATELDRFEHATQDVHDVLRIDSSE
jgi:hypothetical protein